MRIGLLAFTLLTACGASVQNRARFAVEGAAYFVQLAEETTGHAIERTCARPHQGAAAVDACIVEHHFDDARTRVIFGDRAIRMAEAAINATQNRPEATFLETFQRVAACLLEALRHLQAALAASGIGLANVLEGALAVFSEFSGGTCEVLTLGSSSSDEVPPAVNTSGGES